MVAEEGKTVTLRCELSKAGVPVEWWKGEELLRPGQKYQMRERDATHELIICDTVPEDSGVYRCVCGTQKTKAMIKIVGKRVSYYSVVLCFIFQSMTVLPITLITWLAFGFLEVWLLLSSKT